MYLCKMPAKCQPSIYKYFVVIRLQSLHDIKVLVMSLVKK